MDVSCCEMCKPITSINSGLFCNSFSSFSNGHKQQHEKLPIGYFFSFPPPSPREDRGII